jgi:DNA-binding LacI/PurR family transcriptional regulator
MVTLKDIAKASGVSTATVSYVLNDGPKGVLPATRQRVQQVIDELGYTPNAAARSLKGVKTATFGVVFPHAGIEPFENEYFSQVLSGVLSVASQRKQVLMLFTGMSWEEVERNVPSFGDGRCDGFLFIAPPPNSSFLSRLAAHNKKIVLLGTRANGIPVSTVDADNVQGARIAVRRLIELGHRRIGMITAGTSSTSSIERLEGYRRELLDSGIEVDERLIQHGQYSREIAQTAARNLLNDKSALGLTAVFCAHDSIAEVVIQVATELGMYVPDDLSVIGFDDLPHTSKLDRPLTTIHHPIRLIGATAALRLLDLIEDPSLEPMERLFDVYLVERATTSAPARK